MSLRRQTASLRSTGRYLIDKARLPQTGVAGVCDVDQGRSCARNKVMGTTRLRVLCELRARGGARARSMFAQAGAVGVDTSFKRGQTGYVSATALTKSPVKRSKCIMIGQDVGYASGSAARRNLRIRRRAGSCGVTSTRRFRPGAKMRRPGRGERCGQKTTQGRGEEISQDRRSTVRRRSELWSGSPLGHKVRSKQRVPPQIARSFPRQPHMRGLKLSRPRASQDAPSYLPPHQRPRPVTLATWIAALPQFASASRDDARPICTERQRDARTELHAFLRAPAGARCEDGQISRQG